MLGLSLLLVAGAAAHGPDPLSATTGGDLIVAVGNTGLFDVNPDTGAVRKIFNGNDAYSVSFSHDGTRMLFFSQTTLMVADGDGRNAQPLLVDGPMNQTKLSPDGDGIAFLRDGALYVRSLRDPASVRKITSPSPGTMDNYPDWAPRGDRILVGRWTQPAGTAVVIVGAGGGEQQWVYNGAGFRYPTNGAWSPDGGRIATLEAGGVDNGGYHFTVWNADGTDPRVVTPNRARPVLYAPPAWSPDGRTLAFYDWDLSGVDVVGADGENLRTIFSASGGEVSGVTWRPRGSGVTVGLPYVESTVPRRPLDISGAVRSIGSEPAASVTVTISTTNGAIARASLNRSPCIASRSTATCTVASVAGDTDAPLFVVVVPSKPGAATVSVSATAANDAQRGDDATSLTTTFSRCTVLGTVGDDRLAARGGEYVCGLAGDDVIRARNGKRDIIDGGPGNDTAFVDRIDVVRHVEHVKRPQR
ncbi:MAG: cadC 12 [Actinomycetia bacterium]|nr:cadC 12 [Actinomycetes bacterium]